VAVFLTWAKPRRASQAMIDKAIALKKDQPRRSDHAIN
jgi:hypothetical protein